MSSFVYHEGPLDKEWVIEQGFECIIIQREGYNPRMYEGDYDKDREILFMTVHNDELNAILLAKLTRLDELNKRLNAWDAAIKSGQYILKHEDELRALVEVSNE